MKSEPLPGYGFKQLLERTTPARQSDHAIRCLEHTPLALMHVGDDAHLAQGPVAPFQFIHELRQHSDYAAALGQSSLGQPAHQTDRAASVYYRDTLAAQEAPQPHSGILINGG